MTDITNEQIEDEIIGIEFEVSDDALETAAFAGNSGVYTQFAFCTLGGCPL